MNWFKFLIYFLLFANAVLNSIFALIIITGATYQLAGASSGLVYSTFPGLELVNIIYGILALGLAVLLIITRQKLAHYKALGIKLLYSAYIFNVVLTVVYTIATSSILGESTVTSGFASQIIVSFIMIGANSVYFNKRKFMFR